MHHEGHCYLQPWATNADPPRPLGLPPSAGLASDLKEALLLRSSFSAAVHLLPAPPGTECYANSLETHSCPLKSQRSSDGGTDSPRHSAVRVYGGSHHLLWGLEGKWKPKSRRKSPRGLQPTGGFFQWRTFGLSKCFQTSDTRSDSWLVPRLFWTHLSLQLSCQIFWQKDAS